MLRRSHHKLEYYNIPCEGGSIAISPSEGDTHAEKEKLAHFVESIAKAMLTSTDTSGKTLDLYIGTGLHMFDTYASIQPRTKKKNEDKCQPYEFRQLTDGEAAFKQGISNGHKWLTDKADALCEGVRKAYELKIPQAADSKEQRIYVYSPGRETELYRRGKSFESEGQPLLVLQTHQWHTLWQNRENEFIQKISSVLVYFKQGLLLLQNKTVSDLYLSLAGTGLNSTIIDEINSKIGMNKIEPFTEAEYKYIAAVLGLNAGDLLKGIEQASGPQGNESISLTVYAKIIMATWQYFKQKTVPHYKQYLDAGITQTQIEAVFRANLMFTLAELAVLPFFPGHILYMVPAAMDKIYPHMNACTELLFKQKLSLPIKANDPKLTPADTLQQGSSSSSSTGSTLQLSGGYLSQIDQHTLQSTCVTYVARAVDEDDLKDKLYITECLFKAWKHGQQQAAESSSTHNNNNNSNSTLKY